MILPLTLIAVFTLAAAAVAMALRNLIHSALCLVVAWSGIAAFYLWAGAEFAAFGQVMIYVGAVSMVVFFAVLLTRRSVDAGEEPRAAPSAWRFGRAILAGALVAGVLGYAVLATDLAGSAAVVTPALTTRRLGEQLLGPHAAALLVMGLILTVALLGAVVIAATGSTPRREDPS